MKWWGYIHRNRSVQVKRYSDDLDLIEARQSPFVITVIEPFNANSREDAIKYIQDMLQEVLERIKNKKKE